MFSSQSRYALSTVYGFTIRSFINVWFDAGVFDAGETFQDGFKYDFRPSAWNSHANLFSDAFFAPDKFIGVGKGLQAGAFPVCQGSGFFPVVNMGSAAAASGDGICRFVRVQAFVYLADFCAVDIQFQFVRQVCGKGILAGKDMVQSFNDGFGLFCQFVIKGICRDRRVFYCFPAGIVYVCIWFWGRDVVCDINIFPDAHYDNPMAGLGDSVFLKFI